MPAFVAPLLIGAGRLGASLAAEKAIETVAAPVVRRFAGDAMAKMAAKRAADVAAQQGRLAFARNALAGPDIGALGRIKRALMPSGFGEAAMRFGPEVLGMAAVGMSTGSPAAALESTLYSLGGSALGGTLGGGLAELTRGGRMGKRALDHTRQFATVGDMAGGMAGNFMPLQSLNSLQDEQMALQQQQLQERDDQVRRQTLAQLQGPYSVNPYATNPYG